jgi:hypothetical protein
MNIQPLAPLGLWHNPIQRGTHIRPDILVVVLVQTQCARCVLNKQVQKTGLVFLDLWQLFQDRVGDEVGAPAARGEGELFLEPV